MVRVLITVVRFLHHPDPPASLITLTPPLSAVRYGGAVQGKEQQGSAEQSRAGNSRAGQCRAEQDREQQGRVQLNLTTSPQPLSSPKFLY